jgi:hypothetical protein
MTTEMNEDYCKELNELIDTLSKTFEESERVDPGKLYEISTFTIFKP